MKSISNNVRSGPYVRMYTTAMMTAGAVGVRKFRIINKAFAGSCTKQLIP